MQNAPLQGSSTGAKEHGTHTSWRERATHPERASHSVIVPSSAPLTTSSAPARSQQPRALTLPSCSCVRAQAVVEEEAKAEAEAEADGGRKGRTHDALRCTGG